MQPATSRCRTAWASIEPEPARACSRTGVAPNELTAAATATRIAGTPWHKSVPARLEPVGDER